MRPGPADLELTEGGNLVGRDPRQMGNAGLEAAGFESMGPAQAVRGAASRLLRRLGQRNPVLRCYQLPRMALLDGQQSLSAAAQRPPRRFRPKMQQWPSLACRVCRRSTCHAFNVQVRLGEPTGERTKRTAELKASVSFG